MRIDIPEQKKLTSEMVIKSAQIGVPIGMILATGVLLLLTSVLGKEQFVEWGWRLPFLFSIALIAVGALIRRTVEESPVFQRMHQRKKESATPLGHLFRSDLLGSIGER